MDEFAVAAYWARTAVAGAVVLALGRAALLVARSPATRQRLAAGTLRAAVLVPLLTLLPSWWAITVPSPTPAVVEVVVAEPVAVLAELPPPPVEWATDFEWVEVEAPAFDAIEPPPTVIVEPEPVVVAAPRQWTWRDGVAGVVAVYAVGGTYFLGVFALGHLALVRLRRGATLAPNRVREVWGSRRSPAVLVHDGLASPVCFGVVRPAVVLPAGLARSATAEQLAWVLAHEADHLRRGDPLTGWFAGLAKALFFFAPWFWGVRRELRLAQEYLADAAALAAGGHAADYAEFLVDLTAAPARGRRTSLAHGVRAGRSDLSRRITMVLSTTPPRAARRWATPAAVGLFAVAVALSGVTIVRADDKPKEQPAAPQPPDAPKPIEKLRAEAEALRGRADKLRAELRADEDKPRDDARPADVKPARVVENRRGDKPAQPFQSSDVRVRVDVEKLRKQIDEELASGNTDRAKKLIDALVKSLTPAPPEALKPPAAPTPPVPPAVPQPPARELRSTLAIVSADARILDALSAMRKAIEATKDPEARAAMETAFKLLRDMPQERKMTQAFAGPDGRVTVVEHGPAFDGAGGPGGPPPFANQVHGMGDMSRGGGGRTPIGNLGVTLAPLPEALAEQLQVPAGSLLVAAVQPDSPFAKAGVKKNDVFTSVASLEMATGGVQLLIDPTKAKSGKVAVEVVSKGVKRTVEVELPAPTVRLARPAAKKVRFETMKMEVFNGGVSVEAKQGDRQYKITGAQVGDNQLDNAVITITDTKTGKATTQSGTVLTELDERDRAAVTTLLTQIRGQ